MGTRWEQTARSLRIAMGLSFFASILFIPSLQAQLPTALKGVDSHLLAKAKAGDVSSQVAIGKAYEIEDWVQSTAWYSKAAVQGNADAQLKLGEAYETGAGVRQDYAQSVFWYHEAAIQGNTRAQYELGLAYQWELHDNVQAAFWYRKAAENGLTEAQDELGGMYFLGTGVPQDLDLAEMWHKKAAAQGSPYASTYLSVIEARKHELRNRKIAPYLCIAVLVVLGYILFLTRRRLIRFGKSLMPRTSSAKQLAVLIVVACWCSACCIYRIAKMDSIEAASSALLFSAPAVVFGAVCFWWLSRTSSHGKAPADSCPVVPSLEPKTSNHPTSSCRTNNYAYCGSCGTKTVEGDKFCSACGQAFHLGMGPEPVVLPSPPILIGAPTELLMTENHSIETFSETVRLNGIRGWLLLFCIGMTALGPLSTLSQTANSSNTSESIFLSAFAVYQLYVGISVWRVSARAILDLRVFFIVLLCVGVTSLVIAALGARSGLEPGPAVANGIRALGFSIIWGLYFEHSKRVRATFGRNFWIF